MGMTFHLGVAGREMLKPHVQHSGSTRRDHSITGDVQAPSQRGDQTASISVSLAAARHPQFSSSIRT